MVTFQLIGEPAAGAAAGSGGTKEAAVRKQSAIGIGELRKRCGGEENLKWESITMDLINQEIIRLQLAKEFDIWDGLESKLLDYNLAFGSYCSRVWKHDASFHGKLAVLYGLKKDHDKQTVQQVYQAGDFLIKFVQVKDEKPIPVGSVWVKKQVDQTEKDVLLWTTLQDMTLATFRGRIRTMSQLATKHEFCLLDGSPLPDTTTFASYVNLLASPFENSVPSISLRFKEVESRWTGGDKARAAVKDIVSPKLKSEDLLGPLITPGTVDYLDKSKLNLNNVTLEALTKQDLSSKPLSVPSKLDEHEWSLIIQNCHVMNGWYIDEQTNQIKIAARPGPLYSFSAWGTNSDTFLSFTLRKNLNIAAAKAKPTVGGNQSTAGNDKQEGSDKPNAIPSYMVNDGTKIDIVTVEDETRHSFIRNNFEKSSTETTVSGGYGGLGVGVSGGMSSESQRGHRDEQKKFTSKMIGNYMIPRVTLMLKPEDLEPTAEMATELKRIQTKKDAMDVRRFYRRFGQLFAQEVALGGMLVSTRVIEAKETTEEEKTKESFKTAIGLSITTPIDLGVEIKHENTRGKDQSDLQGKKGVNDRVVFEAIGGNTILAANPQQWCSSVGDHLNWRVIERSDLQPMVETISSTPRFENASQWFSVTAPSLLTEFIEIPRSMQILAQIRFKGTNAQNKPEYLVHQANKPIAIALDSNPVDPPKFQGPRVSSYDRATWGARDAKFFVPCISTSGHEPIWTIRKAPKGEKPLSAFPSTEPLGDNDTFCLTFDFINNNRGYRDFVDDERGYRRRDYPEATNDRLLLAQPVDGAGMFDMSTVKKWG
ncbi:hypothetical protein QBC41DRAFT_383282 [Cercophora samala]|uniref:MACPF domain-containing protein n=1 Tax=Cercophora samala TaxID=330535 RepID=A0AA39YZ73_9PEZI|nr:hypothetical protein QBC41DRAFT_383282 [Cercophora samala]